MKIKLLILAGLLSAGLMTGHAQVLLTNQHVDVGIAFEDGAWDLHVHDETNDAEYDPGDAVLFVAKEALTSVPDDPLYGFLGRAGRPVWIAPQVQDDSLLFLGIGAEEIPDGLFLDDTVRLTLVRKRGPGHFALFDNDAFGTPRVVMNTRDGVDDNDGYNAIAGSHAHFNWAFSQPGIYRLWFVATAILADGTPVESEPVAYTFRVQRARKLWWKERPVSKGDKRDWIKGGK
jgi:surface-anchored protein